MQERAALEEGEGMNEPRAPWHPSREELERILDELRPIVAEFARKARAAGLSG